MNLGLILLTALLSLFGAQALESTSPDRILSLSHSNFTEAIEANRLVLVSFYAPWCGYCKSLMAELHKVASDLPNMNIDGRVAIVDASAEENMALGTAEGINGFPSMILYRHGKRHSDYHGVRSRIAILEYLKKRVGPPAIPISSVKELGEYVEVLKMDADLDVQSIIVKNRLQQEHQAPHAPPPGTCISTRGQA